MKTAGRSPGNRGPSSFLSRRAHLLTTCKAGGGIPPGGRARALFTNCLSDISPEGAGNVASEHRLCRRLFILLCQQNDEVAYCPLSRRLPAKTCHWQLYRSYGCAMLFGTPIFSLGKRNRKKNERTVKKNGDLSFRSKSYQPRCGAICCCCFCISELL